MNFYKHHLGDYAAATSHLSWDEDCAYRRLIDQYYKREAPLPREVKDACRLARAVSPAQRRAVEAVLSEFFELLDDGWHQKRCDAEIGAASAQADTNRRIAEEREARRRERMQHESLHGAVNGSSTNRSPATMVEREPLQTPDSRRQTPEKKNPPATPAPPSKPKPSKRCPDSFVVTPELKAEVAEDTRDVDLDVETKNFRDHTFKDARSDWPATWRKWMRTKQGRIDEARHASPRNGQQSFRERDEAAAAEKVRAFTGGLLDSTREPSTIDMEGPRARIGNR